MKTGANQKVPRKKERSIGSAAWPIAILAAGLLSACAKLSPDGGMAVVAGETGSILGKDVVKVRTPEDSVAAEARTRALLSEPLTAENAVQIALLNNRALQAAYNELGASEAQMVQASLPPAPSFSLSNMTGTGFEIERQLAEDVLALLTLPRRREIAQDQFRAAELRAVAATLATGADARRAYYRAVAAAQIVMFLEEARLSAETLSDLAKKLGQTGAMTKLDQARQHAFYAEVSGDLAMARLKERSEREALNRILGLWGTDLAYRLSGKLKNLPAKPRTVDQVETEAVTSRVDLEVARRDLVVQAKQYGLTRATRFIDLLEVSGKSKRENTPTESGVEKIRRDGIDVTFQIPIYDFGEAHTREAEETYLKAVNLLIDKAVNVRADARQAYEAYRGSYDIARYYETEILPLRQIISEQTLLNYNGMLSDLFGLLTDARARILANVKAIEAKRDFWLASVDLQAAIYGGGMSGPGDPSAAALASANPD